MVVEWLPAARRNLRDIVDRISEDNPATAREVAETILARVGRLSTHPHLGRPGRVEGTRELVVGGTPFVVPYIVRREAVIVLRVLHGRQRWPTQNL